MKVKFNKEALLKHRFWIMLAVAGVLIFSGILYLEFVYGGPEKAMADIKKWEGTAKNKGGNFVSRDMINDMDKKAQISIKKETDLWRDLFKAQAPLFAFPPEVEQEFDFQNGKFALEIKVTKGDLK